MIESAPIFIVGVPRSGTTLLAAMLGGHPSLSCGGETHTICRLSELPKSAEADRAMRNWPDGGAAFLASIVQSGNKNILEDYGVSAEEVCQYLKSHAVSVQSIVSALPHILMVRQNRKRWIEKTPGHLAHVATIRKLFPEATIVRIVRDPRDVALSLMKVPWGPSKFLDALEVWSKCDQGSGLFFENDQKSVTIRYEDLVADTEKTLKQVCHVIGETFDPQMLDTSRSKESVNPCKEPWKSKVGDKPDTARSGVWEKELSSDEKLAAEAYLGGKIAAFGYRRDWDFGGYVNAYPSVQSFCEDEEALLCLARKGFRLWRQKDGERSVATAFVGSPESWLYGNRLGRMKGVLQVINKLVRIKILGGSAYWVGGENESIEPSACAKTLQPVLNVCATRMLSEKPHQCETSQV